MQLGRSSAVRQFAVLKLSRRSLVLKRLLLQRQRLTDRYLRCETLCSVLAGLGAPCQLLSVRQGHSDCQLPGSCVGSS